MKEKILQLIKDKPKHFAKMVKNNSDLMQWVMNNTCVSSNNISELIYSALNGQDNICTYGKIKKFNSINEGYRFCGHASNCICAAASVKEKVSITKNNYSDLKRNQINEKRKTTTIKKYGVINNAQTTKAKLKHAEYYSLLPRKIKKPKLSSFQRLNEKYKKTANIIFVTDENEYKGVSNQAYYKFNCLTCGTGFNDYIDNGHIPKCKICNPYVPSYTSKQETEVFDYVQSLLGCKVKQSDKSIINPYELDIVIAEHKVAIEYCGLYWHSEAYKLDKNYHLKKLRLCNEKGYRLITIFEDEWLQSKEIVKSRLKNILGADQKIYARKCQVKKITINEAKQFIEQHHIQGHAIAKIAYGCFFENTLVAVMTFGVPRYDKKIEYELIRYCSSATVVGGAGKLFAAFCKEFTPKSVISYCDMRWGNGNLYKKLQFVQDGDIRGPGYHYTDFTKRYHRSRFTKKKIATTENNSKTEHQIMRDRSMYRIWDCGQTKWIYTTND